MRNRVPSRRRGRACRALVCLLPTLQLLGGPGCLSRKHYRELSDKAVYKLLEEKSHDTPWELDGYHVYPDPRARFGDVSNPDKPPMPPDDPAAHDFSPNPQKPHHKSGVGLVGGIGYMDMLDQWDQINRAERAEKQRAQRERQEGKRDGDGKDGKDGKTCKDGKDGKDGGARSDGGPERLPPPDD